MNTTIEKESVAKNKVIDAASEKKLREALQDKICEEIVENLGGLDNIIEAHSTPDKLTIKFVNREMVDYDSLRKKGAYLLLESRNGYLIRIGNISTMIKDYIVRMKKESIQEFPRVQNETKKDETSE